MNQRRNSKFARRGVVAVEAAVILPIMLVMLLGMWEVGRLSQCSQIVTNAAREGARLAAGGYSNGTAITATMVRQASKDYLTAAGFPTTAVTNATVTITVLTGSWTDPCDALPLDQFKVTVTIPSGAAFNSLRWSNLPQITTVNQISSTVQWYSLNNNLVVVDTQLPY